MNQWLIRNLTTIAMVLAALCSIGTITSIELSRGSGRLMACFVGLLATAMIGLIVCAIIGIIKTFRVKKGD